MENLFEKVISLENLFAAWRQFCRGKRGKSDVQEFERHLENNLFSLHLQLKHKTYRHGGYRAFFIHDPKKRLIHKAAVRDRVLHHGVYRILYPIFDKSFIFDSYSCRNKKGTHKAVDRLRDYCRKVSRNYHGKCFALKCDVRKFFDSVDQEILLELIRRKITEPDLLWLISGIVGSFSRERERVKTVPARRVCRLAI